MNIAQLLNGKTPTNVSIDQDARAIYFRVSGKEVSRTNRINSHVSLDYDSEGEVVGLEIIRVTNIKLCLTKSFKDISSCLPSDILATA